jgi:hypothetical protein
MQKSEWIKVLSLLAFDRNNKDVPFWATVCIVPMNHHSNLLYGKNDRNVVLKKGNKREKHTQYTHNKHTKICFLSKKKLLLYIKLKFIFFIFYSIIIKMYMYTDCVSVFKIISKICDCYFLLKKVCVCVCFFF